MSLTSSGEKVRESMEKHYGKKKGKNVFYASMNKGIKGSDKWQLKKKVSMKSLGR